MIKQEEQLLFPSKANLRLRGTIEEAHIYDNLAQSLHQIDTAQVGSCLCALIRDIKSSKVSLSLLNSRIAECKQLDFEGQPCFHLLGLKQTDTLAELGSLDNRMAELGLTPYAVCSPTTPLTALVKYDANLIREAQNIQWAEDLYESACELEAQAIQQTETQARMKLEISALEHFSACIDFDSFNDQAWRHKAKLQIRMRQFKQAEDTVRAWIHQNKGHADDEMQQLLMDAQQTSTTVPRPLIKQSDFK